MTPKKMVEGNQEFVPEVEVNVDTVYERTDVQRKSEINEMTKEKKEYWLYNEVQYSYQEWLQKTSDRYIEQQKELNATQEAIDYLMLSSNNSQQSISLMKVGASNMAITPVNYIVMRIEKELELKGLEQAKSYYDSYFNIDSFKQQFKEAVDAKLIADGHENVIDKAIV